MEDFYKEFGRLLREKRQRAGVALTQDELAKKVGLSRTSITNIEAGNQQVSLHLIYLLARAVSVAPQDLLPSSQFLEAQNSRALVRSQISRLPVTEATKGILQSIAEQTHNN